MDIPAAILELAGVWIIGNRCRWGFVVCLGCNGCWVYAGLSYGMYGLVAASIAMAAINTRNFVRWSKKKDF